MLSQRAIKKFLKELEKAGAEDSDLKELVEELIARKWLSLAGPSSPSLESHRIRVKDQLPERIRKGWIRRTDPFSCIDLLVTEVQKQGKAVSGRRVLEELKQANAPVLRLGVGKFLYENQRLIVVPEDIKHRITLVFWEICRDSDGYECVHFLRWNGNRGLWEWDHCRLDYEGWDKFDLAVCLREQSA